MADDYKKLYETKEGCDVIIFSGQEPNVKKIRAHSLVLRTRSTYFRGVFSSNWAEKTKDGCFVLKKPNVSGLVMDIILKFLYCGVVDLKVIEGVTVLELLVATDELGIQKFMDHLQEFLIKNCYDFLQQDSVKMLHIVTRHEAFGELRKVSFDTICKNPDLLFSSNKFFSLEEDVLKLVLKCDDLDMNESIVWERIIKWGIAQHKKFKSDVKKFANEDFETLKATLCELLLLVRFHQIDKGDFISKVWPFRRLLSDDLIEDILRCHLVSGAVPLYNVLPARGCASDCFKIDQISSVLINEEIARMFVKWITKTTDNKSLKKVHYSFNLLFRSSRDGFSSYTFHQRCDNKGATIVVGYISDSNQLVGGYNPLDWNGNNYKNTTDSFLFSLSDFNNPQSATLGRVVNGNRAVYCNNSYGPTFGGGHDLYAPNNSSSWSYNEHSYPNINISGGPISITDYEVFQVVRKN
ncbi:7272_t:CDS:2 [Cetraspora pellucida]|uniref:7272_t:CDS:1 n=1 Tax=Cetraspora pellucida TaxID=1433469 RepID=A0A9N9DFH4_9GLOM|nr:7272_t:CDS:2 [Cetraspora pellucida]